MSRKKFPKGSFFFTLRLARQLLCDVGTVAAIANIPKLLHSNDLRRDASRHKSLMVNGL